MEDHRLGCALGPQHVEYLGVGVAVVDHQRFAGALGEVDVPGERFLLGVELGAAVQLSRPVHVESGLADRDDAWVLGQPLDDGPGLLGQRVGARRVQRDGGVDPRVEVGGLGDPPGGLEVVSDSHDRLHADGRGPVHDRDDARGVGRTAGVQVGVRVDQRGQRLGGRRLLPLGRALGLTRTQ